jgi:glycosyltransferase involved in cell wall biosynthesis
MSTLSRALAARGYQVTAAMPSDEGNVDEDDFRRAGLPFVPLTHPARSAFHRIRELAGIFEAVSPTLVHAHGSRAGYWAYWALLHTGRVQTQLIVTVHGFATPFHSQPRRLFQSAMERRVGRRAGAVIACAEAERNALLRARVASAERVHVVPYGVELSPFVALTPEDKRRARIDLGVAPERWLLVMICRLDRPRDFGTLLRAFRRVVADERDARLFIVGGGPERAAIQRLSVELELDDHVRLWGFRKDVTRFLAAADAFVLTSWGWEGLPISVIEAQAAALPVVVTDAGGSKEAIVENETGLLVPRLDEDALGSALRRLAASPRDAASMGALGRKIAAKRFGVPAMVAKIEKVYSAVGGPAVSGDEDRDQP